MWLCLHCLLFFLSVASSYDDALCPSGKVEANAIYEGIKAAGTIDVDCMHSRGGDINFIDDEHGWGPLTLATFKGREDYVDKLLDLNADVNVRSTTGRTALVKAAYYNRNSIAKKLLQRGCDCNIQDNDGMFSICNISSSLIFRSFVLSGQFIPLLAFKKNRMDSLNLGVIGRSCRGCGSFDPIQREKLQFEFTRLEGR